MDMNMDMDMGSSADNSTSSSDVFCMGSGSVMFNGFQTAHSSTNGCVLFLFKGWVLNTAVKYAFGVIGAFLMGCTNEALGGLRAKVAKRLAQIETNQTNNGEKGSINEGAASVSPALIVSHPFLCQLLLGGLYGTQMVLAYWMMLLVMLYEGWIFAALVIGLAVGHMLFSANFESMRASASASYQAALKKSSGSGGAHSAAIRESTPTSTGAVKKSCCHGKDTQSNGKIEVCFETEAEPSVVNFVMDPAVEAEDSPVTSTNTDETPKQTEELPQLNQIHVHSGSPCCGGSQ